MSWTVNGNTNFATVQNSANAYTYFSYTYVPFNSLTSPFSIPATAYAGSGVFKLDTQIKNYTTTVTGAAAGSSFEVFDELITSVTVFTPTFTPTPTQTLTPVDSYTPTSTPTITPTPTVTATSTSTPPSQAVSFTGLTGAEIEGVRYDGNGNLWVTDEDNQEVQKWTTAGSGPLVNIQTFNGGSTFHNPNGLGIDPATGNVYVADTTNHLYEVFNSSGNYLASFGSGGTDWGVAVNAAGTTVYADEFTEIVAYAIGGTASSPTYTSVGSLGNGTINGSKNLSFDGSGNLWVADTGNDRVLEFNPSSGVTEMAVTLSYGPTDVAVDGSGNLFIPNYLGPYVQEYNSSGQWVNQWNDLDVGTGLTTGGAGLLYISNGTGVLGFNVN